MYYDYETFENLTETLTEDLYGRKASYEKSNRCFRKYGKVNKKKRDKKEFTRDKRSQKEVFLNDLDCGLESL